MIAFAPLHSRRGVERLVLGIGVWCALLAVPQAAEAHLKPEPSSATGAALQGAAKTWRVAQPASPSTLPLAKVPQRLVLKLRAGAAAICLSCALARREAVGEIVPGSRLDDLNRRFGVHGARPLLQAHARGLIAESHATLFARSASVAARFALRQQRAPAGAQIPDLSRVYVLDVRRRWDLEQVAAAYAADPAVEYCEPDRPVEAAFTPNDPYLSSSNSWGQGYEDLWGVKKIQAPQAWDSTYGAGITVAVVDTGIDYTHPDLATNVWTNPEELPSNGIDEDGNGYVDDYYGWNFVNGNSDPMDDHFHGTHVAGTIAAVGDNGIGIVGVAFGSRVMGVKALDKYGWGATTDLANAIVYAVDNGADVINASWGGSGRSALIADAIAYAHAHGVVFVAAAGNSAADTADFFPANDPNAITVAATTHLDEAADFSNFGIKLDVAAPGGGDGPPPSISQAPQYSVLSLLSSDASALASLGVNCTVGTKYLRLAGTSMAAPHVSGVAALILALHPSWSVEQVRQVLRTSADDLGDPGPDPIFAYGRLNAARAVTAPQPLDAHISSPVAQTLVGQTEVTILGTAAGPGFASYSLEYGPAPTPAVWTPIAGPVATPMDDGTLAIWDVSQVPDGDYLLRLRVDGAQEYIDRAALTLRNIDISAPARLAGLRPDAPIEIRGTAAGVGFQSYTVEYRRPGIDPNVWQTDGITLAVPPGTPVRNGLLATLDVRDLTSGDRFDFRVTTVTDAGSTVWYRSGIVIDPSLHPGWPQPIVPVPDRDYLTIAGLDGSGKKEILVGSGDEVVVFEPDGSVRPGWPQSVATATNKLVVTQAAPLVADVTGDAAPEVIATNHDDIFVWSADGVLLPGWPVSTRYGCGGGNMWLTAADLDGDGKDEILCNDMGFSQAFFGDGTTVPNWTLHPTSDAAIAAGDVFGDGTMELAMFNSWAASWIYRTIPRHTAWLRAADRSVIPPWPLHARGSFFTRVGMAVLTGDGQLDVVVLNEPMRNGSPIGPVSVKAFTPAGKRIRVNRYKPPRELNRPRDYTTNALLTYADLNHDGFAEAYLYANLGTLTSPYGQFVSFTSRKAPPQPQFPAFPMMRSITDGLFNGAVAIGDIDGDGQQELIATVAGEDACPISSCRESDLRRVALMVSKADGTLMPQFPKPVPQYVLDNDQPSGAVVVGAFIDDPRYASAAIADLDGDGLKEVVWVDPVTNLLLVWDVPGTPGPELADWPMYHHDPKHTNVLPLRR